MGDVLPFVRPKPIKAADKFKGKTLCREGFHKWVVDKNKQFDVKLGKLVTVYICARCGEKKVQAH